MTNDPFVLVTVSHADHLGRARRYKLIVEFMEQKKKSRYLEKTNEPCFNTGFVFPCTFDKFLMNDIIIYVATTGLFNKPQRVAQYVFHNSEDNPVRSFGPQTVTFSAMDGSTDVFADAVVGVQFVENIVSLDTQECEYYGGHSPIMLLCAVEGEIEKLKPKHRKQGVYCRLYCNKTVLGKTENLCDWDDDIICWKNDVIIEANSVDPSETFICAMFYGKENYIGEVEMPAQDLYIRSGPIQLKMKGKTPFVRVGYITLSFKIIYDYTRIHSVGNAQQELESTLDPTAHLNAEGVTAPEYVPESVATATGVTETIPEYMEEGVQYDLAAVTEDQPTQESTEQRVGEYSDDQIGEEGSMSSSVPPKKQHHLVDKPVLDAPEAPVAPAAPSKHRKDVDVYVSSEQQVDMQYEDAPYYAQQPYDQYENEGAVGEGVQFEPFDNPYDHTGEDEVYNPEMMVMEQPYAIDAPQPVAYDGENYDYYQQPVEYQPTEYAQPEFEDVVYEQPEYIPVDYQEQPIMYSGHQEYVQGDDYAVQPEYVNEGEGGVYMEGAYAAPVFADPEFVDGGYQPVDYEQQGGYVEGAYGQTEFAPIEYNNQGDMYGDVAYDGDGGMYPNENPQYVEDGGVNYDGQNYQQYDVNDQNPKTTYVVQGGVQYAIVDDPVHLTNDTLAQAEQTFDPTKSGRKEYFKTMSSSSASLRRSPVMEEE